ncbi:hypothetical protein [Polynucleobacter sp. Fuers-14]|uniref:hypothetical protein n=1 Tax=Polynucleobacter sp. Fuers-14 TaxID=1758364 RepID=UPI001C0DF7EE|nr:hypothetical protein [Polynucleobacter sp. Fuers-14]MBU3642275.1 hypothetical protein [Polynucleobacter sp. Fuers-14]
MKKIMKYPTVLEPVYIAVADDRQFHVLYEDASMSSHNSISDAVLAAAEQCALGISGNILDWEVLALTV